MFAGVTAGGSETRYFLQRHFGSLPSTGETSVAAAGDLKKK